MEVGHDLSLAFPSMKNYHHEMSSYVGMPKLEVGNPDYHGMAYKGLNNPYVSNSLYLSNGFPMQEIKPNLGFSIDGLGNRSYTNNGVQDNSGKILFPFGDMKQHSNLGVQVELNKEQGNNSSSGYWNEMVDEGSSW
ncbi:unnamed protein product [Lupinus luteus]|uniref:Uncharacterized protein n=1 Tax=Lupinus luteus TaxID=3873 RepID=A0AAV1VYS7_LUPLU